MVDCLEKVHNLREGILGYGYEHIRIERGSGIKKVP